MSRANDTSPSWWRILCFAAWMAFGVYLLVVFFPRKDDSDGRHSRSGMEIRIDHLTGCEYLQGFPFGSATPRLDRDGKQICYRHEEDIPK